MTCKRDKNQIKKNPCSFKASIHVKLQSGPLIDPQFQKKTSNTCVFVTVVLCSFLPIFTIRSPPVVTGIMTLFFTTVIKDPFYLT